MITNENDYSSLLENLRYVYNNYFIDEKGIISDNDFKEYNDQKLAINLKFILLYCSCFKKIYIVKYGSEMIGPRDYIFQALTNTSIFNSFMDICIREYQMYGDIGTGNTMYYPYDQMANFLFINYDNKKIIKAYLDSEMDNIINIQNGLQESKKLTK